MLCTVPKSLMVPSLAPWSMSRRRIVSKASGEAAWRPRWSMRPRPHIGVCRSGSVFPSIVTMLSKVWARSESRSLSRRDSLRGVG